MEIILNSNFESLKAELVATVGFFDGVHAGHRYLIDELKKLARSEKRSSAVITFRTHPRKVLQTGFQPSLLTTFDEKLAQLAITEIDYCIVLNFNVEMAALSAFEFLDTILFKKLNVHTLLVGHDHRFGHNRAEGYPEYQRYGNQIGIKVVQASRFMLPDHSFISSSEIRSALQHGEISRANKLLGYSFQLKGTVTDGFKMGRKIGFPTANVKPTNNAKIIPTTGVYVVLVHIDARNYGGMLNIGIRPTLDNGTDKSIEVNIFDFEDNIYNQEITLFFVARIRDEVKFDALDKLIRQLELDKITSQNILKKIYLL